MHPLWQVAAAAVAMTTLQRTLELLEDDAVATDADAGETGRAPLT